MPVIDNAIYVDGVRTANPASLDDTFEQLRERNGLAWIGLYHPTQDEIASVAEEFGLHPLAVEDAQSGHQRSKIERYDDTLFLVLRPARYIDEVESVEFGELHVFLGPDFVVTLRQAESPDLAAVRRRLENDPGLLSMGTQAILYAIIDEVVDQYAPVVAGLQNDIDEIEDEVFDGNPGVSRRVYELLREVIGFQRAVQPLVEILDTLAKGADGDGVGVELQRLWRDVHDHVLRVEERIDPFRVLLQNSLTAYSTIVGLRQNDEMQALTKASLAQSEQTKKISSWAAILFAPTLIGTIYGMNFSHMPELEWPIGYPLAITAMVVMSFTLYSVFKSKHWL